MSKNRTKLFILFCIVCVLTTTGCISKPGTGNQTIVPQTPASSPAVITSGIPNPSTTETPPIIRPSGTPRPPTNETPYIIINPIGFHHWGEIVDINGTTNLGIDERLQYVIYTPVQPGTDSIRISSGLAEVSCKDPGTQVWSFRFNSSENLKFPSYGSGYTLILGLTSSKNSTIRNMSYFAIVR